MISHYASTLALLLCAVVTIQAQSSFFIDFPFTEVWNNAQVTTQEDGFLLANDLSEPGPVSNAHTFFVARFDSCAQLSWAYQYELDTAALFLSQVEALEGGRVAVSGQTGAQDVFLLLLDPEGQVERMQIFHASVLDQSAGLVSGADGIFMLNRLRTEGGTRDWVLRLEPDGSLDWSRQLGQADGTAALAYGENGLFCRSGTRFFGMDITGQVRWGQELAETTAEAVRSSGAVGIANQYYIAVQESFGQPYKLHKWSTGGALQAVSAELTSEAVPALAGNEEELIVVTRSAESELTTMIYNSAGTFQDGRRLLADGNGALRYFTANALDRGKIFLAGTGTEFNFTSGFVATLRPGIDWSCAEAGTAEAPGTGAIPSVRSITIPSQNLAFEQIDSVAVAVSPLGLQQEIRCSAVPDTANWAIDTTIVCTDEWLFESPLENATYQWDDGSTEANRTLIGPDRFTVDAATCGTNYTIDIHVDVGYCPCDWYVPNAFSPNGDERNDQWQLFPNCPYRDYSVRVFDRWGALLFESDNPEVTWDGKSSDQILPAGSYLYVLNYEFEIQPGRWRKQQQAGTLNLLR